MRPSCCSTPAPGGVRPYWAELDANATSDARRALIIRPARNLDDGQRYIVALRDMRDGAGAVIHPAAAFAAFLHGDGEAIANTTWTVSSPRSPGTGVERDELYLAWDFTVASTRNLSQRMLHIRDDAFASLAGAAPHFTVTQVRGASCGHEPPCRPSHRRAPSRCRAT